MEESVAAELVKQAKPDPHGVLAAVSAAQAVTQKVSALLNFAKGRALYELARNDDAIASYREAIAMAEGALADRISVSLAAAQLAAGDRRAATAELERIERSSDQPVVVQLASCQLALIELGAGDLRAARTRLLKVVPVLEADPDEIDAAARALGNLAYCEMTLGDLDASADLYRRSIDLGEQSGETLVVAGCLQNIAYIDVLRGSFPNAIAGLKAAHAAYVEMGAPNRNLSSLFDDMAEAFGLSGLTADSVLYARRALDAVRDGSNRDKIAEAQLRLAACLLDAGALSDSVNLAHEARSSFESSGRSVWVYRSTTVEIEALPPGSPVPDEVMQRGLESAAGLRELGWSLDALRVENRLAEAILAAGGTDRAMSVFVAYPGSKEDSTIGRLEVILGEALRAEAAGDSVELTLAEARRVLWDHQVRLGDPELRAGAGRLRERFRRIALRAAQPFGASMLLEAEEQWRALAVNLPRVLPLPDGELAELSREVRRAAVRCEAAPADIEAATRRSVLEDRVRSASMASQARGSDLPATVDTASLQDRLGARTFVEWIEVGDEVIGIGIDGNGVETWPVRRSVTTLAEDAAVLAADLSRVLRPGLSPERLDQRWTAIRDAAKVLGDELLPAQYSSSSLVLSPAVGMTSLPFALMFPDAIDSQLTVSATAWLKGSVAPIEARVGVFVGPDLTSGIDDARSVSTAFPGASTSLGSDATAAALKLELARVSILHIAAHGSWRSDSPLFSSVRLADGPLTLYELPASGSPDLLTLASCDSGAAAHYTGGETVGMATAWIASGSRRVIAPICAIPDAAAARFTDLLYSSLAGRRPETALARAQKAAFEGGPVLAATAATYQSWGPEVGFVSKV